MWKHALAAGTTVAAIVGAGTVALASTPDSPTSGSGGSSAGGTASTASGQHVRKDLRHKILEGMKNSIHGEFVTKSDDGTFVTHEVYRGQVTAVSATSIAVKAADDTSLTYVVTSDTKVFLRDGSRPHAGTIGDVRVGDKVLVSGTGASSASAHYILDTKGSE